MCYGNILINFKLLKRMTTYWCKTELLELSKYLVVEATLFICDEALP